MEFKAYTYLEYIQLPHDERIAIEEAIRVMEDIHNIDAQSMTWGEVAQYKEMISGEITYQTIYDMAKKLSKRINENTPFHIILGMFNSLRKSIEEIILIENEVLSSPMTPDQLSALNQVGGFGEFGSIPQTMALIDLLGMPYDKILEQEWSLCFSVLAYDKKRNDFKKILHHD